MKKQDVLALLSELPEEFDASQFVYTLTLKHKLERAEADLTAGHLTPNDQRVGLPSADRSLSESERARYQRREQILTHMLNNRELMEQVYSGIERIKRGERGTPFREILARERRGAEG
jgi:hypothetical protein